MRMLLDMKNRRKPRKSQLFCSFGGHPWTFPEGIGKRGLVPAEGFEPPTYGLQNRCTTTVLSRLRSCGPIIADPTSQYLRPSSLGRPARHSHQQVIQRDDTRPGDCK